MTKYAGLARLSGGTANFALINTGGIELLHPGGMNRHGRLQTMYCLLAGSPIHSSHVGVTVMGRKNLLFDVY